MFSNAYQNNQALEVFDAKVNVDKNVFYKQLFKIHPSSNHKQFDKEVKSYLYNILGQNTKMVMPADDSKGLALHQRYLVLHIFIPIGSPWTLEFTMNDLNGIKRRINITTSQGKQQIKYFSFRYPLQNLKKGVWLFLGIDVLSFMNVFKDQTFRSLDQITLGSCCRLRRIFTMKQFVQWEIPKNFWLSNQIPQEFQLIQYDQNQTKFLLELSKQLTEPKSPKNPKKVSISPQNQGQNKSKHKDRITNSKSSIIEQPKQNQKKKYTQQILKSDIIQNAKNRLEYLQKQQQKIKNQSIQVSSSKILLKNQRNNPKNINPNLNVNRSKQIKNNLIPQSKKIHINKSIQLRHKENSSFQKIKIDNFQNSSLEIKSKIMPKNKKNKKPVISKAFKEDITIEMDEDQSSNFTQEHMRMHLPNKNPTTPYGFESKEEIIEEDQWSQQEHISRPISQAISNLTGNFPSTIITKQNNKEIILTKKSETQMELIYDQMVGCYYHPESNSYYQLKH